MYVPYHARSGMWPGLLVFGVPFYGTLALVLPFQDVPRSILFYPGMAVLIVSGVLFAGALWGALSGGSFPNQKLAQSSIASITQSLEGGSESFDVLVLHRRYWRAMYGWELIMSVWSRLGSLPDPEIATVDKLAKLLENYDNDAEWVIRSSKGDHSLSTALERNQAKFKMVRANLEERIKRARQFRTEWNQPWPGTAALKNCVVLRLQAISSIVTVKRLLLDETELTKAIPSPAPKDPIVLPSLETLAAQPKSRHHSAFDLILPVSQGAHEIRIESFGEPIRFPFDLSGPGRYIAHFSFDRFEDRLSMIFSTIGT